MTSAEGWDKWRKPLLKDGVRLYDMHDLHNAWNSAWQAAESAVREECAKIRTRPEGFDRSANDWCQGYENGQDDMAEAIRKGK